MSSRSRPPSLAPALTLKLELGGETAASASTRVRLTTERGETQLAHVANLLQIKTGTFHRQDRTLIACIDLPKGSSRLVLGAGE